ncbi:hypothetical protein [Pedosphaera parvula]|uniref:Uncharacterized protein n=1 Tax=Pedosphaera parvula (strain Ellin514) TaxID=320771 RepID=B9X9X2_PEDPL|nr:hypothetical protein [Pedosphaera parvula]EEF63313.1 hypothetical protein Cflav_PD5948 [Pedosphaera parvula Ellin514]
MKKRNRILITLAITVALCGLTFTALFSREPSYQGKCLSAWIKDLQAEAPETKNQAREAVREIGVNGMPLILGLLHSQDSPLKLKSVALAN